MRALVHVDNVRSTDFYRSLEGSFSAGSTATIATKYSFFQVFRDLQSTLSGEKKVQALFFSRKKYIWWRARSKGALNNLKAPVDSGFKVDLGFNVALWVPRRAARAPWGLPTPDLRSTLGQRSVNLGSTLGNLPTHLGPIFADFAVISGETWRWNGVLIWNDRFSNRETAFSGFVLDRSPLRAPWEKKKRIPNVLTRFLAFFPENYENFAEICDFQKNLLNFLKISVKSLNFDYFSNIFQEKSVNSCRFWKMLKNAPFLITIGVDTAENEPRKGWCVVAVRSRPPILQLVCGYLANDLRVAEPPIF